jgi:O-antigen ligase
MPADPFFGLGQPDALDAAWANGAVEIEPYERSLLPHLITVGVFLYVFTGVGLQGIPGVARSALACVAFLWGCLLEGVRRQTIVVEGWIRLPLAFLAYCVLMILRSQDPTVESMGRLMTVWGGALGVGVALRNGLAWTVPVYAMICAALASLGAHWLGINSSIIWAEIDVAPGAHDRAAGLMGNANALAIACGMPAYLVLLFREQFSRPVRVLCMSVAIYGVIVTGSRKGVLLVLCLLLCIGFHRGLTRGQAPYVVLCILAILLGALLYSGYASDLLGETAGNVLAIQRTIMAFHGGEGSMLARIEMIEVSQRLFWERPLLGYGLGMFSRVSGLGMYSHNNYCELAVGGGIIAVALFYAIYLSLFAHSRYLPRRERLCVQILLASLLLQDGAVVSYLDRTIILTLIMLVVLAYRPALRGEEWGFDSPQDEEAFSTAMSGANRCAGADSLWEDAPWAGPRVGP